jgi:hypothetical protein
MGPEARFFGRTDSVGEPIKGVLGVFYMTLGGFSRAIEWGRSRLVNATRISQPQGGCSPNLIVAGDPAP